MHFSMKICINLADFEWVHESIEIWSFSSNGLQGGSGFSFLKANRMIEKQFEKLHSYCVAQGGRLGSDAFSPKKKWPKIGINKRKKSLGRGLRFSRFLFQDCLLLRMTSQPSHQAKFNQPPPPGGSQSLECMVGKCERYFSFGKNSGK